MTAAWLLNSIGLLVTTIGGLLMFLAVYSLPPLPEENSPDARRAYTKRWRLVITGMGLLSLWLVLQCAALIFI
jgi:hypothetical protein